VGGSELEPCFSLLGNPAIHLDATLSGCPDSPSKKLNPIISSSTKASQAPSRRTSVFLQTPADKMVCGGRAQVRGGWGLTELALQKQAAALLHCPIRQWSPKHVDATSGRMSPTFPSSEPCYCGVGLFHTINE